MDNPICLDYYDNRCHSNGIKEQHCRKRSPLVYKAHWQLVRDCVGATIVKKHYSFLLNVWPYRSIVVYMYYTSNPIDPIPGISILLNAKRQNEMEKSLIENKIVKLLTDMYPGSEYKALVTASAIVDFLIAEKLIILHLSKTESADSSETTK